MRPGGEVRDQWPDPHLDIDTYDADADLMALNMGPQHPSTHGVLRIKLFLDGETIIKAVPYPGYLHRGVEKLTEQLTYVQIVPIVDKHDYVSPMTNEQAICVAIENANNIVVPRRSRYL
ncbi:MAG: NADH-quinone oxidoreductase subunit D, partial [Kiritimatiellia bacterium]